MAARIAGRGRKDPGEERRIRAGSGRFGSGAIPADIRRCSGPALRTYETLCLTIGAGEGHNWWGVLYPKLCYGAQSCLETGTERRLRFFVLEKLDGARQWVEEIMAPLKGNGVNSRILP